MKKTLVMLVASIMYLVVPARSQHLANVKETSVADLASIQPVIRYHLPWNTIMMEDIKWIKRVWREIDVTEAANSLFNTGRGSASGLFETLAAGAVNGSYAIYEAGNDRFTTELKGDALKDIINAGTKSTIKRYRIKEDWLCLKNDGHVEVRILGIAPVVERNDADDKAEEKNLCWFYYPEVRMQLAASVVPVSNQHKAANWDEIFQYRNFTAPVKKVTHRE